MLAKYNLKNGETIEIFFVGDYLKEKTWYQDCEVYFFKNNKKKTAHKKIFTENNHLYILWDGQKVFLTDFNYLSAKDLVEYINSTLNDESTFLNEDIILSTLYKESEKLKVLAPIDKIIVKSFFGLTISTHQSEEIVECKFIEDQYDKSQWNYKIEFAPIKQNESYIYSKERMYFSDFVSSIRQKDIKLVLV